MYLFHLIKEAKELAQLLIKLNNSRITCQVFEANQGAIAITKEYPVRPRTKHINVKSWHFNKFMYNNQDLIRIHWIKSLDQISDIFTEPLGKELLERFHIDLLC